MAKRGGTQDDDPPPRGRVIEFQCPNCREQLEIDAPVAKRQRADYAQRLVPRLESSCPFCGKEVVIDVTAAERAPRPTSSAGSSSQRRQQETLPEFEPVRTEPLAGWGYVGKHGGAWCRWKGCTVNQPVRRQHGGVYTFCRQHLRAANGDPRLEQILQDEMRELGIG